MKVNKQAVQKAKELINNHQYIRDSDWSEAQPSPSDENTFLESHNWNVYGEWFLAVSTTAGQGTKERHAFPYGDFHHVHRSGLIAVKQRAAQNDYDEIEKAADELLTLLDETKAS